MKENLTEIVAIIDASGSMSPYVSDTIGGFNEFLEEQKKLDGEAVITLTTFNSINPNNMVYSGVDVNECPKLDAKSYKVDGMTPLYDAIGHTVASVGNRLANTPEEERPSKVLFLIATDGEENFSKDFTQKKIKEIISHQKQKYNWEFVFTAANIDTQKTASGLNISTSCSYDQLNTRSLYSDTFNKAATSYRSKGVVTL